MKHHRQSKQNLATGVLLENLVRSSYTDRAPGELQPLQWSILRYLSDCGDDHATVGSVARYLGLSHAPVSRSVATLVRKECLMSNKREDDSRISILTLTKKGYSYVQNDPLNSIASAIDRLPFELAEKLREAIELIVIDLVENTSRME